MDDKTGLQANLTDDDDPYGVVRCRICERRFGEGARFCPFDGERLELVEQDGIDPLIGRVVDQRYEVRSMVGEGGMGAVYRVRHCTLGREFALKALRVDIAREQGVAERFLREARSAAAISHPNVCEIVDFGMLAGGRPYFVMELLRGKPLSW